MDVMKCIARHCSKSGNAHRYNLRMDYDHRYPSIGDLKTRAHKRMPRFAFDYVDGAIDDEHGKARNRNDWHSVILTPRYLRDVSQTDLRAQVFGHEYAMPFGVAPVGLGNMMWPGAEAALAAAAQNANVPYILSTFSTTDLSEIARLAPDVAWFQLYVPRKEAVMADLIKRVARAGFRVLVVTLDIPVGAKRNRELKNGLKLPFRINADLIWQCLTHPAWSLQTARCGRPDFVNVARYRSGRDDGLAQFITDFNMQGVTADRVAAIRKLWNGALVLKGVQHVADIKTAAKLGVDGVIVSNHGGRQLDAAPTSVQSLREIADMHKDMTQNMTPNMTPNMTVMVDSGIRTGMDVVRARALGACMTFGGRAFFWGVGAMGTAGAGQVCAIFRDEITRTLKQLGCDSFQAMGREWLADEAK